MSKGISIGHMIRTIALVVGTSLMLTNCGKPISPENPLKREKINDGVSRKILLEDGFPWTQSFARITAYIPEGE
jgi:hypothetical protein